MTRLRLPVLTYHSANISGNDYASNDHVALASDLQALAALGLRIVGLPAVVAALRSGQPSAVAAIAEGHVALSFDDGQDFDYLDLVHPTWGPQRSLFNVLRDFREAASGATQPHLHATSFVIVSPEARRQLDVTCMIGRGWWTDDWWAAAAASGLLSIGNHSWDHNHPTLPVVAQWRQQKGGFEAIDSFADAEAQVAQSARYLRARADNDGAALFAYPYGESNDYLVDEYFPRNAGRLGMRAAFTCDPEPITADSNIWRLPRYVCGRDWKSGDELARVLRDAA